MEELTTEFLIDGEHATPHDSETWKSVEVVLDAIFKFLPIDDLKNVRLTCKKWCSVGGTALASKAVVRLTNEVFERDKTSSWTPPTPLSPREIKNFVHFNDSNPYFIKVAWEICSRRMVRFCNTLKEYIRDTVWASGFRPKIVSILGCQNIWRLPHPQFSTVEQLQVVRFKPAEATWLLHQFRFFFPNLKCLELYHLQETLKPNGCNDCECICWSRSIRPPDTSLIPPDLATLPLEKVAMEIGPGCNSILSDVLLRSPLLRVLVLHEGLEYHSQSFFSRCLKDVCENANLPLLEELTLSFTLSDPGEIALHLNKLKVKTIVLNIRQGSWNGLLDLLKSLNVSVIHAIKVLQGFSFLDRDVKPLSENLESLFGTIGSLGFFNKDVWEISLQNFRFRKTRRQFVFQASAWTWFTKVLAVVISTLFPKASLANSHNYAFRRVEGIEWSESFSQMLHKKYVINDSEIFDQSDFLTPQKLRSRRKCLKQEGKFPCTRCLYVPKFLCDLEGFRQDAGIELENPEGSRCGYVVTWTFCQVPPQVVSKWAIQLEAERAAKLDLFPSADCF